MPAEPLRVVTFCMYLGAWLISAVAALLVLPRLQRQPATVIRMGPSEVVGMLMQGASALPITLRLTNSPLRPVTAELIGTIVLAPVAVGLLCWTLWSLRGASASETLVTKGPYSWMRHPMYSAFLAMLLATGLVVSARLTLIAAVVLYVAGTELRITSEEGALEKQFPIQCEEYRLRTRWRYVPGLR